jgi:hypothetical protein
MLLTQLSLGRVTCYAQATHRYIYSFFPAFRAPSFLTIIPIYTHIIPTAPTGLDRSAPEDDRLKIVLNKVARHWSGMSDEKNPQLPLMVSKDHRALQQLTRRAILTPATNYSTYEVAISNSS